MFHFTTSDGCRLYYEISTATQDKPAIVLLNGTFQTTVYWTGTVRLLHHCWRVICYDARAQGRSDIGESELNLERHARDLHELLGHLHIDRAHLLGLSHGASVALAAAARHPQSVRSLLLCSVGAHRTPRAKTALRSWLEILRQTNTETMTWASFPLIFGTNFLREKWMILDKMAKTLDKRNSRAALMAHLSAMSGYPPLTDLATRVNVPTLVISAADDPLVCEDEAQRLAEICHGQHKRLIGVGHSIPFEAPDLFINLVTEFLIRSGSSSEFTP